MLTSGRYPSRMKITEKETSSNSYYSAATTGYLQASRDWSGPPAVLQQRGLNVKRKTKKQKDVTSSSTKRTSTQRPHLKVTNFKDHRWINPQRWEENSAKRRKTPKTRTPCLLQRTKIPPQQANKAGRRMTVT